ncbi:MAG: molybdopterin-dependent oxidoreductase [bacterium]|nr:molybdopterin-dependent oxidoreductase [bacterium]
MAIRRRDFLKWAGIGGLSITVSPLLSHTMKAFNILQGGEAYAYYLPTEFKYSMCGTCDNNCGVILKLVDGVVKEISGNPADELSSGGQGKICVKGQSAMRNLYDPDLLKKPLKRTNLNKGKDEDPGWVAISWDEAFTLIAERIRNAIDTVGPRFVLGLLRPTEVPMHFVDAIGTPNQVCHVDTCYITHDVAWWATLGVNKSRTLELEEATYLLCFGYDMPGKSKMAQLNGFLAARGKGAKIVVFDPRLSVTANMADEWFAIKPGTDLAVVLAMIQVIINENLYNAAYVSSYCYGFDELAAHVNSQGYTPEWAESICGIPADDIRRIAREFAASERPLSPAYKRDVGGPLYANSFSFCQAQIILNALVGAFERVGGFWIPRMPATPPSLAAFAPSKVNYPPKDGNIRVDGQHLFPSVTKAIGGGKKSKGNFSHLADGLRRARLGEPFPDGTPSYPVKVIISHSYDSHSFPNPDTLVAELCNPDIFLVVIDTIPSNIGWLADVVLPETWWVEIKNNFGTTDQHSLWNRMYLRDGVGALWDRKGFSAMVNGILNKLWPGQFDIDWGTLNLQRMRNVIGLGPTEDPVAWLRAHNGIWENKVYPPIPQNLANLGTPSKKIELYSQRLAQDGHEPMPVWHPKLTERSAADEFYVVTNHTPYHRMNKNRNDYLIMDLQPENLLYIHPDAAAMFGLKTGDYAWISSPTGKTLKIRVKVIKGIRPDTVMTEHGYGHFNRNLRVAFNKGINDGDLLPESTVSESLRRYPYNAAMGSAILDTVIRILGKA